MSMKSIMDNIVFVSCYIQAKSHDGFMQNKAPKVFTLGE